jgi:hypothetical protein
VQRRPGSSGSGPRIASIRRRVLEALYDDGHPPSWCLPEPCGAHRLESFE